MDEPLAQGFPFEWAAVSGSVDLESGHNAATLFQPLDIDLPELKSEEELQSLRKGWQLDLLSLEGLDPVNNEPNEVDVSEKFSPSLPQETESDDKEPSIWQFDAVCDGPLDTTTLRTWEAFDHKTDTSKSCLLLSEAGPRVFDAALLELSNNEESSGSLPADETVLALSNLALGRSSIFFQWNAEKQRFLPTLERVPISGLSVESSSALVERVADCGSTYRLLMDFATTDKDHCSTIVALRRCITSMLDAIDSLIVARMPALRSLLQVQSLVDVPRELLLLLLEVVDVIQPGLSDEEVISSLADRVHRLASTGHPMCKILNLVLTDVCAPWLEKLATELGLSLPASDDGQQGPATAMANFAEDGSPEDAFEPTFVSQQDRKLVQETRKSLRLLREHFGLEHSLSNDDRISDTGTLRLAKTRNLSTSVDDRRISESLIWADGSTHDAYIADLEAQFGQRPTSQGSDLFRNSIIASIQQATEDQNYSERMSLQSVLFDPLEGIRSDLQRQHSFINIALLRRIFKDVSLRSHFDIQRQFHLFGNGNFVSRLSTALFSAETQSAERKRGNIPTGETMGLRLGARETHRWPPASSELRLTLMGLLNETYEHSSEDLKGSLKDLPGGLSFSIRELPDEEIEKVMDAGSIYALDFLRLSYTPPPSLETIITSSALNAYDDIFRFVLKFIRTLHVTTTLREQTLMRPGETQHDQSNHTHFSLEAHHFTTALTAYIMDTAIRIPWQDFTRALDQIEKSILSDEQPSTHHTIPTPSSIQALHDQCLERIRTRLFLRRRSEPLRSAIEDVLSAILRCASSLAESDDEEASPPNFHETYVEFRRSVRRVLELLGEKASKPPASGKNKKSAVENETAEENWEALKMLLVGLDFNGYYRST